MQLSMPGLLDIKLRYFMLILISFLMLTQLTKCQYSDNARFRTGEKKLFENQLSTFPSTNTYSITYSSSLPTPISYYYLVVSLSSFHFLQTNSLAYNFTKSSPNTSGFVLKYDIGMNTAIYSLKISYFVIDYIFNQIQIVYYNYTCYLLNQTKGYRSQNITYTVTKFTNYTNIKRQVFLQSFNMTNIYRDYYALKKNYYQDYLNHTVQFYTGGFALVHQIQFYLIIVNLQYQYQRYQRLINAQQVFGLNSITNTPTQSSTFFSQFRTVNRWMLGISGFNFTKRGTKKFQYNSISAAAPGNSFFYIINEYLNASFIDIDLSTFAIVQLNCNGKVLHKSNYQCFNSCPVNEYPDSYYNRPCKACHYSCLTCNGYEYNKCVTCQVTDHRILSPPIILNTCPCDIGYFNYQQKSMCEKCSDHIVGCKKCTNSTLCTQCQTYASLYHNKCYCNNLAQHLLPTGCINRIIGCQLYGKQSATTYKCTQCYVQRGFSLKVVNNGAGGTGGQNIPTTCQCVDNQKVKKDISNGHGQWWCMYTCGNAYRSPDQQCDDNNVQNGDGCNQFCQIQKYYDCAHAPLATSTSVCKYARVTNLQLYQSQRVLYSNTAVLNFTIYPYFKYLDQITDYLAITTSNVPSSNVKYQYYCFDDIIIQKRCYLSFTFDYTNHLENQLFSIQLNLASHNKIKYNSNKYYFKPFGNIAQLSYETQDNLIAIQKLGIGVLVLVIITFVIVLISLPIQKMVGVQLIMCVQFIFFLLTTIQNNPVEFTPLQKNLKYSNGYNKVNNYTYYSYAQMTNNLNHQFYQKQFFLNMNYMFGGLVFVTLLFLMFKLYKIFSSTKQQKQKIKNTRFLQQDTHSESQRYPKYFRIFCNYVFFVYVFFVMNQTIFNCVISYSLQAPKMNILPQSTDFIGVTISLLIITLTLYSLFFWFYQQYRAQKQQKQLNRDKSFIPYAFQICKKQYILLYSIIQPVKIGIVAIFFDQPSCLYIILVLCFFYFIYLAYYRPYVENKIYLIEQQYDPDGICISIHNFGICFNQFLIITFCVMCIVWNDVVDNFNFDADFQNTFVIIAIVIIVLLDFIAILRLLYKKLGHFYCFANNATNLNDGSDYDKMRRLLRDQKKRKYDSNQPQNDDKDNQYLNQDLYNKRDKIKLYQDIKKNKQYFANWKDSTDSQKQDDYQSYDGQGRIVKPNLDQTDRKYRKMQKTSRIINKSKFVQMQSLQQKMNNSFYKVNKSSEKKNAQLNNSFVMSLLQKKQQQFNKNMQMKKRKLAQGTYQADQKKFLKEVKQKLKKQYLKENVQVKVLK